MNWKKIRWLALIVIFIFATLLGPLVINLLFKLQSPFPALIPEWDSGDALSYYAVIISSAFAIVGISLTIQSSREELQENLRNDKLPFFVIDYLDVQTESVNIFSTEEVEDNEDLETIEYAELRLTEVCFIINENEVEAKHSLSKNQKAVVKNRGIITENPTPGIELKVLNKYVYTPFVLENVGSGPAIHLQIGLNRVNSVGKRKYTRPISLKSDNSLKVLIYSDDIKKESSRLGKYDFEVFYFDIYGNRYKQSVLVHLQFKDESNVPLIRVTTMSKQEVVEG